MCLTTGKTVDIRDPRIVVVHKCPTKEFCPVRTLELYSSYCAQIGINLKNGYFSRPLDSGVRPVDKPLSSSTLNERLKRYLLNLNMFEGETPHGTRSGCALTLAWLGLDNASIKLHVGWKSDKMLHHYTQVNDVYSKTKSAKVISECSPRDTKVLSSNVNNAVGDGHLQQFIL